MAGEVTDEQVQSLAEAGIRLDTERGPTTFAGHNELGPMVTYMRVDADDETDARVQVGEVLGVELRNLVAAPATES